MKTLVVTGASRGLGAYIAEAAVSEGFQVVGLARTAGKNDGYEVVSCDVRDANDVNTFFKQFKSDKNFYGVINAAGVASMNLALTTPSKTVAKIIDINLNGTINCSIAAGKILCRHKIGRIVNFSTIAVPLALKGEAVYAASKAGVEMFSRTFAREVGDFGITVNVVAPGPIPTDLIKKVPQESIDHIVKQQIIQKQGSAQDVWNVISLLLDSKANMISGEVIHVGGV